MNAFFRKPSPFAAQERVVIVEVNWLGDVLFSTPAIRAIRKKHPGAYITALIVPRCKTLLLGNNYLDEVMALDEEGRYRGFFGKLRLVRDLKIRRFNIAYILRPSLTRTLCLFLAGVRRRIGFATKKTAFLLTEKTAFPKGLVHRADIYYYLVTGAAIPAGERYCDFFVAPDDRDFIDSFLEKHRLAKDRNIVTLHVGGNWDLKRWPKDRFARLIDVLAENYQMDVVISGAYTEYSLAEEIAALAHVKPFIACGLTTLKQLGVLFQKSAVVISADSGPLHVAAAVGARVLSLFGPTSPELTGPLSRDELPVLRGQAPACSIPCYNLECRDNVCMRSITVEQVVEELEKRGWLKR
ncbi:MAG: lipopolysaccharide heptosyltransferase II [Candidatus Omnitrophica bacterium]|nr:lipopolysaccharide heptosyltransferase II [Candidatus Omnitrophota bacterium]MDD5573916.1 lipopolysaccharide heptosyltransferase II [Candidatus Omnitrophota bacterium]